MIRVLSVGPQMICRTQNKTVAAAMRLNSELCLLPRGVGVSSISACAWLVHLKKGLQQLDADTHLLAEAI